MEEALLIFMGIIPTALFILAIIILKHQKKTALIFLNLLHLFFSMYFSVSQQGPFTL